MWNHGKAVDDKAAYIHYKFGGKQNLIYKNQKFEVIYKKTKAQFSVLLLCMVMP